MSEQPGEISVREALRAALPAALRRGDKAALAAIRSALGAIENAEATAPGEQSSLAVSEHIAGGVAGLGAGEAPRVVLTEAEELALVSAERDERRTAAARLQSLGQNQRAEQLIIEAEVLDSFLC